MIIIYMVDTCTLSKYFHGVVMKKDSGSDDYQLFTVNDPSPTPSVSKLSVSHLAGYFSGTSPSTSRVAIESIFSYCKVDCLTHGHILSLTNVRDTLRLLPLGTHNSQIRESRVSSLDRQTLRCTQFQIWEDRLLLSVHTILLVSTS